jgi:DNA-binding LytR/AlgR family response regulator
MIKALEKLEESAATPTLKNKIAVRKEGEKSKYIMLNTPEINHIQSNGNSVLIYTDTEFFVMNSTLENLEKTLGTELFQRVHRTVIVNKAKIIEIENLSNNEYQLKLKNGKKIWTGRKYASVVQSLLKI